MLGQAGSVIPDGRGTRHLILGLGNGLAGFQCLDQGQVIALSFDPGRDPPQERRPLGTRGSRPFSRVESPRGSGNGGGDVALARAVVAAYGDVVCRTVAHDLVTCP